MVKKATFLKGNLRIYKCFRDISYIFSSVLKKNYKMRPDFKSLFAVEFCSLAFFEVTDVNGFHNVEFGPGGKPISCSVFR